MLGPVFVRHLPRARGLAARRATRCEQATSLARDRVGAPNASPATSRRSNIWSRSTSRLAAAVWDRLAHDARDFAAVRFAHDVYLHVGDADGRLRSSHVPPSSGRSANPAAPTSPVSTRSRSRRPATTPHAERVGLASMDADPDDLWARHALAHVYESTDDQAAAIDLLEGSVDRWSRPGLARHPHVVAPRAAIPRGRRSRSGARRARPNRRRRHHAVPTGRRHVAAVAARARRPRRRRPLGVAWPTDGPASTSATPARSSTCTRRWRSPAGPTIPRCRLARRCRWGGSWRRRRPTRPCSVTSVGRSSTPSCRSAVVTMRRAARRSTDRRRQTHRIGGSVAQRDVIALTRSSSRRTTMTWSAHPATTGAPSPSPSARHGGHRSAGGRGRPDRGVPVGQREGAAGGRLHGHDGADRARRSRPLVPRCGAGGRGDGQGLRRHRPHRGRGQHGRDLRRHGLRHRGAADAGGRLRARWRQAGDLHHRARSRQRRIGDDHPGRPARRPLRAQRHEALDHRRRRCRSCT